MSNKTSCESFWGTKHNFNKWIVIENGDLINHASGRPLRQGFFLKQERECSVCGFREISYKEFI